MTRLIDWEDVASLTDEQRSALEQCAFWGLGDFDLIGRQFTGPEPWIQRWLDKQNEGDRCQAIDFQGYDDEEANLRKHRT